MVKILLKLGLAKRTLETVFRGNGASLIEVIKYRRFIFFGPPTYSVRKINEKVLDSHPKTK